jgi:hypothetical protein
MAKLTKASEERIKLIASTLSNVAVGAVSAGILGPIIAAAIAPTLDTNAYDAMKVVFLVSIVITAVCCGGAWWYLGELDR